MKNLILSRQGVIISLILAFLVVGVLILMSQRPKPQNETVPSSQKIVLPDQINSPQLVSVVTGDVSLGVINVNTSASDEGMSVPLFVGLEVSNAKTVAEKLGFSGEPNVYAARGMQGWEDSDKSLIIDSGNGQSLWSNQASPSGNLMVAPQEAIPTAEAFLKEKGFKMENIKVAANPLVLLSGGNEPGIVSDFAKATFVEVRPEFVLNNWPILNQDGSIETWSMWVDKYFNVVKFGFNISAYLEAEGQRQIISEFEAVDRLKNGQGTVVSASEGFNGGNLESSEITEISLGYYPNPDKVMVPVYKIVARGILKNTNKTIDLVIYIQALK